MGGRPSQYEPRSHFGARLLLLAVLLMPSPLVVVGASNGVVSPATAQTLMQPLLVLAVGAVLLAGPMLFRDLGSSSDGSDGDDGGGGPDPGPPPSPPTRGPGRIPLPDALPGWWRVRDHVRPALPRRPARRPAREPGRPRVPD
jgi:hypothetical protein